MRYLYDHGLPFSEKITESLQDTYDRVLLNKASLIIVDGGVGEGKTTLCIHLMDYINKLANFPPVELDAKHFQLAMGGSEFLSHLRVCYDRKFPAILYDEAGDFNRRGSLTRFNAMINRTFETFRALKIIVILSLPSFHILDMDIFDKNIPRILFHLNGRTEKYGKFKAYSLYRMLYLKDRMKKLVVKSFAYELVDSNFRGQFLNLPPTRERLLDKISTKSKITTLKKSEIDIEGLLSYSKLAEKLGRSVPWVRLSISKLKIKETKKIGMAKYFNEITLNRLAEHLDDVGRGKR